MSNTSANDLIQKSVFSEIVKEVFGDIRQYEATAPQDFLRPCFQFSNSDKSTKTQQLTAALYKTIQEYTIYFFAAEDAIEALTSYKDALVDYLMGIKKVPIPETDCYYTIERVVTDTDNKNFIVTFIIEVSRIRARNLQRPTVPKIKKLVNSILIDGRNMVKDGE